MSYKIIQILEKCGPMLSGDLARKYEQIYGVSNEAARKAISRCGKPVNKITNLSFDKNQKFFYLEAQFMSRAYIDNLLYSIEHYSKVNWIFIKVFLNQNGFVSKERLPSFTASPVKNVKGHKLYERVVNDLISCNIISEFDEEHYTLNQQFITDSNLAYSKGIEVVKHQIISDFNLWARKINMIGYYSGKIFEYAEFANFKWGLSAPSYIHPLYNTKQNKAGFVVADVFYGKQADVVDIEFFIEKLRIIKNFKHLPPFIPVLLTESVTEDALNLLKDNKVLIGIIGNIFTEKYVEILKDILNVFCNSAAIIYNNPKKIESIFQEISKSESRYNNIIGDLFELMVGYFYSQIGCKSLSMKKIIFSDNRQKRELDIIVEKDGKIIIVECKGTRTQLDEAYVDRWITTTIPIIKNWVSSTYPSNTNNIVFELWAIGGFTQEAEVLLANARSKTKKYDIHYFNRSEITKKIKDSGVNVVADILKQHYPTK